jgi:hypothetical protein
MDLVRLREVLHPLVIGRHGRDASGDLRESRLALFRRNGIQARAHDRELRCADRRWSPASRCQCSEITPTLSKRPKR